MVLPSVVGPGLWGEFEGGGFAGADGGAGGLDGQGADEVGVFELFGADTVEGEGPPLDYVRLDWYTPLADN